MRVNIKSGTVDSNVKEADWSRAKGIVAPNLETRERNRALRPVQEFMFDKIPTNLLGPALTEFLLSGGSGGVWEVKGASS